MLNPTKMNFRGVLELLTVFQCLALSQQTHVQVAKQHIRAEVRSALGHQPHPVPHYYNRHYRNAGVHYHNGQRVQRLQHHHHYHHHHHHPHQQHKRWSGRHHSIERHQQHFSTWSSWSPCGGEDCVKRRERYCRSKRKCGHTKHVEERKCWRCHTPSHMSSSHEKHEKTNVPSTIVINAAAAAASGHGQSEWSSRPTTTATATVTDAPQVEEYQPPVEIVHPLAPNGEYNGSNEEIDDIDDESDFYVLKTRRKIKRQRRPTTITNHDDYNDYKDDISENDDFADFTPEVDVSKHPLELRNNRRHKRLNRIHQRNLAAINEGIGFDADIFQYEDFDFEPDASLIESYEQMDYDDIRNISSQWQQLAKERATPDALIPKHRRIYSKWSRWTKCSPKCTTRRYKKCRIREQCGREVLREIAYCYTEGSFCQQWLQAQVQKTPAYDLRPVTATRRMSEDSAAITNNAIVSDYIMNGKGYRGAEYAPMKLKCGIASIRSNKRNMYNMLKIIGGKASRKGEWPWQVAIFNRFKEAFCGGTLIAPQWVLTAAHCVRKVLYVRIGEHNLDYEDGTELQLRVLKSFKHPNFDKKTVDSDVALLRLPKLVNATTWIGFSCLPRPYQPLPKNVDCTVIGWGKRRNRDIAGTSVLHQAEVPIIPMDNCRSVYHDYTITKNMFCAGHKRGRIDTCAGDSGGPLLCRDTTKPNHPWTMFGITSFGDGCAKRNKFGIYAKVPNYVDWVWSVVNCNGNCKLHQRSDYQQQQQQQQL